MVTTAKVASKVVAGKTPVAKSVSSRKPVKSASSAIGKKMSSGVSKLVNKSTTSVLTRAQTAPPKKQLAAGPSVVVNPADGTKANDSRLNNAKKIKVVRDSFTFPKGEYEVIGELKARALRLGHGTKKSELLRAGIKLLAELDDNKFKTALLQVPAIKTGRPKKR